MWYPGDVVPFLISLATPTGAAAVVVTPPYISILDSTGAAIDVAGAGIKTAAMTLIPGTDAIYSWDWNTGGVPDGNYVAVVSYNANAVTVNSRLLTSVRLGDSRITAEVAPAVSTARTVDLPDKADVMLKTDFVAPSADESIQTILAKVVAMPANLASQATLTQVLALLQDVHDVEMGSWVIDKTSNPNRMTLYRVDGAILQSFDLTRTDASAARNRS